MPDPEAGVPATLATARAAQLRDVRYDLEFAVPATLGEPVDARASIRFFVAEPGLPVVLDFAPAAEAVQSVTLEGRPVQPKFVNGHIVVPAEDIRRGDNTVQIA